MIIEPCCCHKQLPPLCRDNEHRLTVFHTNGDVTIEKMYHAVGCLIGPAVCTVITPAIDLRCAQYLEYCIKRGWISSLRLMTAPADTPSCLVGDGVAVTHVTDKRISEASCMFILEGADRRLCITGYLPPSSPADTDNRYRLVTHTLLYTTSEPPLSLIWDEVTRIPLSPFRTR